MVEEGLPEGLFDSASAGSFHAVAAWLNEGGGVDARYAEQGRATLLIAAAFGGQEAMVRMLLQRGASVGLQASGGSTALMAAALRGHTTIVQVLLDAKADASLQDIEGITALMMAENQKHTAVAQLLRQHAKRQTTEAEAAVLVHATGAAPTPNLLGRRVRIDGLLKGRPELNGRCGVAVEGEAEAVLLRPANLQEFLEPMLYIRLDPV
jgi:hypothetical protein